MGGRLIKLRGHYHSPRVPDAPIKPPKFPGLVSSAFWFTPAIELRMHFQPAQLSQSGMAGERPRFSWSMSPHSLCRLMVAGAVAEPVVGPSCPAGFVSPHRVPRPQYGGTYFRVQSKMGKLGPITDLFRLTSQSSSFTQFRRGFSTILSRVRVWSTKCISARHSSIDRGGVVSANHAGRSASNSPRSPLILLPQIFSIIIPSHFSRPGSNYQL